MTAHTPGPWTACDRAVVVTASTHGYDTWLAACNVGGSGGETQVANAKLMAASPSLLDALSELTAIIDAAGISQLSRGVELGQTSWAVKCNDRIERARAAIAKATAS